MKSSRVTAPSLRGKKHRGEKITVLTAYDATFARLLDQAGIDVLLVGDSLGMVIGGNADTLSVTLDEMIYHCRAVVRGTRRAQVVGDMPFMSYQVSVEQGVQNAGRLMKEGGCQAVKIEGGAIHAELVGKMVQCGIPVMGHIGLLPQSVHQQGGFKVQGREEGGLRRLMSDAMALQQAGAYAIVLEGIPSLIAAEISAALQIPTIGIGAGNRCDGQVLVIYDLLGMDDTFQPTFVRRFDHLAQRIRDATSAYIGEVKAGTFPTEQESFAMTSKGSAPSASEATPYSSGATSPVADK